MAQEQQDSTRQLLQQVVEQLALQTAELKHIRRSTRTTNQILLAIQQLNEQLLHVLYSVRHAVYALTAAANSYLASIAAAQQAARLHAALSSGRLMMLLSMTLLALINTRTAFSRRCLGSAGSAWAVAVQKAVTGLAGLLGASLQQKQQASMLWTLAAPARSAQCMLAFAGCYGLGMLSVLAWTSWAFRKQQQHSTLSTAGCSRASTHAAAVTAGTPVSIDPIISLLLAAAPTYTNSSSNSAVLGSWAVVLQAALYEGLLGSVSLRLLGGRWWLWLLLWEAWLAWIAGNLLSDSSGMGRTAASRRSAADVLSSDGSARKQQLAQTALSNPSKRGSWVEGLPLPSAGASGAVATVGFGSGAAASGSSTSGAAASSSTDGILIVMLQRTGLAVLHLGLPVVLAAAGLWR